MEPQLPQVLVKQEGQPVSVLTPEQSVDVQNTTPEAPIDSPEIAAAAEQSSTDSATQTAPPIIVADSAQDDTVSGQTDNSDLSNPTTAADSDVIEKEWVSKAKAIVSSTSNDPHKQQDEVSKLMADYVLKRYGRIIGESNG